MNQTQKNFMLISMWVAIIAFITRCIICSFPGVSGIESLYQLYGFAGEAIGFTGILMFFYNKWWWKKLNIKKRPVLAKRYVGIIRSSFDNIVREAELEIEQTFLSVHVKMKTGESSSNSLVASIEKIHNEERLVYIYINEPKGELQSVSSIHYGCTILKINNPKDIYGNYFTGRETAGSLEFKVDENI